MLFRSEAASSTAIIVVSAAAIGGTADGGTAVCTGTNSTPLSVTGYSGTSLQWQSSVDNVTFGTNISGATKSTYTLATADRGYFIRVTVKATNVAGSSTAVATTTSAIA